MSTEPEKPSLLAPLSDEYEPTPADADRVLAKIQASLVQPALGAPSSPKVPSPPPSSPAGAGAATALRGGRNALLVGLSCAVFVVLGGVVVSMREEASPNPAPPRVTAPAVTVAEVGSSNGVPVHEADSVAALPSVSVESLPSAAPSPSANKDPKKVAATAVTEPVADTLEREARILADARRARQGGDGERALALLDEHARLFPSGWLASDRAAERIVVLCSLGRREQAVREAAAFLAGRPKGPLTRRVELSCAGQP